jgi:hypothetical protein
MSRYIDADELIVLGLDNPDDEHLFEFVPKEFIDNAPTADVVEVKRGKWIDHKCSLCGFEPYDPSGLDTFNFCSNCGADMRGGNNDGR